MKPVDKPPAPFIIGTYIAGPMEFRLIELETLDVYTALALDEVAFETVKSGGDPILRFWTWGREAATIGRFQSLEDELDLEIAKDRRMDITRRMSGGGAMYHGKGADLVYSICVPGGVFSEDIIRSYAQVQSFLVSTLSGLGIVGPMVHDNSIMVGDRKVSGSSQRRSRNCFLQHGTILHRTDPALMSGVLRFGKERKKERAVASNIRPVVSVFDLCGAPFEELYKRTLSSFLREGKVISRGWEDEEVKAAEELAVQRYRSLQWVSRI